MAFAATEEMQDATINNQQSKCRAGNFLFRRMEYDKEERL
jgi:hypothetical protein